MAEEIVASGGLVPDDIMLKVITSRLDLLRNKVSGHMHVFKKFLILTVCAALDFGRLSTDIGAREAFRHTSSVGATMASSGVVVLIICAFTGIVALHLAWS